MNSWDSDDDNFLDEDAEKVRQIREEVVDLAISLPTEQIIIRLLTGNCETSTKLHDIAIWSSLAKKVGELASRLQKLDASVTLFPGVAPREGGSGFDIAKRAREVTDFLSQDEIIEQVKKASKDDTVIRKLADDTSDKDKSKVIEYLESLDLHDAAKKFKEAPKFNETETTSSNFQPK